MLYRWTATYHDAAQRTGYNYTWLDIIREMLRYEGGYVTSFNVTPLPTQPTVPLANPPNPSNNQPT